MSSPRRQPPPPPPDSDTPGRPPQPPPRPCEHPFSPKQQYFVYIAPEAGGGKRLLIVDKLSRFGGHGETYDI